MLTIVEIIDRSQQGITRPFLCRADDGDLYFVKSANAGRKALVAEWIAGCLAREIGLPVPAFDIAEVPADLRALRSVEEQRDWGTIPVFASRKVEQVVELRYTDIPRVSPDLQAQILLFDAWIGNGDRTLGEKGGNPNLLWSDADRSLHVIDHNLAFEDTVPQVLEHHAFAQARSHWGLIFHCAWPQRLTTAAARLDQFWGQLPEAWVEDASELMSLESVRERLRLFTDPADPAWGTL